MISSNQRIVATAEDSFPSALAPRYTITTPSSRPTDLAFAYFVRFFGAKGVGGTSLLWTDSREYAEQFAARNRCYAKPAKVQTRDEWSAGRSLGFSRRQQVVR